MEYGFEYWHPLTLLPHHYLRLCDRIYCMDVIQGLVAVPVALMHPIDVQKARSAPGGRLAMVPLSAAWLRYAAAGLRHSGPFRRWYWCDNEICANRGYPGLPNRSYSPP